MDDMTFDLFNLAFKSRLRRYCIYDLQIFIMCSKLKQKFAIFERQTKRVLIYWFIPKMPSTVRAGLRLVPGAGNSIQVFHKGGNNPITYKAKFNIILSGHGNQ